MPPPPRLRERRAAGEGKQAAAETSAASRPTVVIVDDSMVIRTMLRSHLQRAGYTVVEADDGVQALAAVRGCSPDVVLLDIEMPVMDGYEMLTRLKADPSLRDIPVVIVSGRSETDDLVKGLRLGAHDYLRKPFEPAELTARVRSALRTKVLQDTLKTRTDELIDYERLAEISMAVAREGAGVAVREAVCRGAVAVCGASFALFLEMSPAGRLQATAWVGSEPKPVSLDLGGVPTAAGRAFIGGDPLFVPTLDGGSDDPLALALGEVSLYAEPVRASTGVIGVLAVGWKVPVTGLSPRRAFVVRLFADEAGRSIERAGLLANTEKLARLDPLTGIANRRVWDAEAPREVVRAARADRPLCVAVIDIDRFKEFNDEHGHQVGDRLLSGVAAAWFAQLRETDLVARYGGDEFGVLLPNAPIADAVMIVERLRSRMLHGQTCSAGVALWDGDETAYALVARADAALFEAKRAGRDRTVIAP